MPTPGPGGDGPADPGADVVAGPDADTGAGTTSSDTDTAETVGDPRAATTDGARRRGRRWGVGAVTVMAAVGLVVGLTVGTGGGAQRAPHFSYPRLGGGAPVTYPLAGAEAGHPMVLSFFASWCSPCRTELPTIARLASGATGAARAVVFVGIDGNDDPASGLAFARQSGVHFAVGADSASALAPRFGLDGYPDTVFIDATGTVAGVVRGPVTRAELVDWVHRLSSST